MAMVQQGQHGAYQAHQSKNLTDREIEARALLRCANQLDAASKGDGDQAAYKEAVQLNQRLWTIFQVALCDPGNPLPVELKNILLNLSCYVDKVSFRALADYQPQLLAVLVDINRNIAAGLSKKPPESGQTASLPPQSPPTSVTTTV